jgi:hypothetical protein
MIARIKAATAATALVLAVSATSACDDHNDDPRELSPGWTQTPCFYDESKTCWAPPDGNTFTHNGEQCTQVDGRYVCTWVTTEPSR